jgi:hypothetical protein
MMSLRGWRWGRGVDGLGFMLVIDGYYGFNASNFMMNSQRDRSFSLHVDLLLLFSFIEAGG